MSGKLGARKSIIQGSLGNEPRRDEYAYAEAEVNICHDGGSIVAFSEAWAFKNRPSEGPEPNDPEWLEYCRLREFAERMAAKRATSMHARWVHQELAQAYSRIVREHSKMGGANQAISRVPTLKKRQPLTRDNRCARNMNQTTISRFLRTIDWVNFGRRFPMPRELIDTGTDKRYVRRDNKGQFKESDDVGRSLAQDQKHDSKTKPKRGEGDRGDR